MPCRCNDDRIGLRRAGNDLVGNKIGNGIVISIQFRHSIDAIYTNGVSIGETVACRNDNRIGLRCSGDCHNARCRVFIGVMESLVSPTLLARVKSRHRSGGHNGRVAVCGLPDGALVVDIIATPEMLGVQHKVDSRGGRASDVCHDPKAESLGNAEALVTNSGRAPLRG